MITPEQLWEEKYAPRHEAAKRAEDEARSLAFTGVTTSVCGYDLRPLTGADLLILDLSKSCFFGYRCELEEIPRHVMAMVWLLSEQNQTRSLRRPSGFWAMFGYRRMLAKLGRSNLDKCVSEIIEYVDAQMQDSPARCYAKSEGNETKPVGASFLASLVIRVSAETGWSENEIVNMPLCRLFQYIKLLDKRALGADYKEYSVSDKLLSEYIDELNNPK